MNKCERWQFTPIIFGYYEEMPIYSFQSKQTCLGILGKSGPRKCTCDGDITKCDFYPEKRKEGKMMNTAEMWIKAQEDRCCYETSEKGNDTITLYYQKDKGLFYEDGMCCGPDMWNYFDDLMNDQWQLRTMTKAEAEAKFNIKIVGD